MHTRIESWVEWNKGFCGQYRYFVTGTIEVNGSLLVLLSNEWLMSWFRCISENDDYDVIWNTFIHLLVNENRCKEQTDH